MSAGSKTTLFVVMILIALGAAFSAGVVMGYYERPEVTQITDLVNKESEQPTGVDFGPFWKTWRMLDEKFVNTSSTSTLASTTSSTTLAADQQKRVWGAIAGLVDSLDDPYTTFFPPVENKAFNEEIKGNFGGVGMEVGTRDGQLVVIAPLKGTPAFQAGILAGDKILEIDGQSVGKLPVTEAVSRMRGEVGTKVKLKIGRGTSETHEYTITRAQIEVPTVEGKLLPGNVFKISFYTFSARSADLFREALREFVEARTDKLIIDLRGNPGGYLDAAVDTASWFLPAGEVVAVEDHGGGKEPTYFRSKGYNVFSDQLKLVILVDGGSASASEIFAGALSEHSKATLVGQKTFGKGSVQELVPVTPDTSLKVTVARWLTPKGTSISHNGIVPDVEVPFVAASSTGEIDNQLARALEVINAMKK